MANFPTFASSAVYNDGHYKQEVAQRHKVEKIENLPSPLDIEKVMLLLYVGDEIHDVGIERVIIFLLSR